jgi:hypothetical protein
VTELLAERLQQEKALSEAEARHTRDSAAQAQAARAELQVRHG